MISKQLALTALVTVCLAISNGCPQPPRSRAKPYVKPSATNGGPEDDAIRAIEAAGGTCFRYQEIKSLLVERDSYWLEAVEGNPIVCVCVDDCKTPEKTLMEIAKLKQLQSLCIRGNSINDKDVPLTDQHARLISEMTSLRELRLENTNITAAGITDLAKLKLEHLNFDYNSTDDESLKAIATIDTLKELHLHGSQATATGYAELAALKELKFLSAGNGSLSDAGLKSWSAMNALEELSITNTNISGVGFEQFENSGIRILKLNYCKISPAGIRSLSRLTKVEELSFFSSSLTDAGLEALAEMPKLKSLDLYGNAVTEAGLRKLLPSPSLKFIDVTDCKITHAECQRFNRDSANCVARIIED